MRYKIDIKLLARSFFILSLFALLALWIVIKTLALTNNNQLISSWGWNLLWFLFLVFSIYIPIYHLFILPKGKIDSDDPTSSNAIAQKRLDALWNRILAIPFYYSLLYFIGSLIIYAINPPQNDVSGNELFLLMGSLGYVVFYLILEVVLSMRASEISFSMFFRQK